MAYDAEKIGSSYFLVLEYVEGETLAARLARQGALPVEEACRAAVEAARGLAYAHERGLIHRDIKPSNLMRTPTGEIKLLGFGLARPSEAPGAGDGQITGEGTAMGTPDYIAPEQARDARQADIRSDLYSLGCTLYHLLSGQVPFPGGTSMEKMVKHMTAEPQPLAELCPHLPPEIPALVHKMMAKDPGMRYAAPADMIAALMPLVSPTVQPAPAARRRPARALAVGSLAVIGLIIAIVVAAWPKKQKDSKPTPTTPAQPVALGPAVPNNGIVWTDGLDGPGGEIQQYMANQEQVNSVQLTPDGAFVVTAGYDGFVRVWDRASGKEIRRWKAAREQIWDAAISPNGQYVVTAGTGAPDDADVAGNYDVRIWALGSGRLVQRLDGANKRITSLKIDKAGTTVFAAGEDGVYGWSMPDGVRRFHAHGQVGHCMIALSPDDRIVAFASPTRVGLVDAGTGQVIRQWPGHRDPVLGIAYSPDNKHVATGSLDRTIRLWEAETGREVQRWPIQRTGVSALAFSPDGQWLATTNGLARSAERWFPAGFDYEWRIWNVETCDLAHRGTGHSSTITRLDFTGDGRHLITAASNGVAKLWRLESSAANLKPSVPTQVEYQIDLSKEALLKWLGELEPRRMRPKAIHAYLKDSKTAFIASAVSNTDGRRWFVQVDITQQIYDASFQSMVDRGFGPTRLAPHVTPTGEDRITAIWETDRGAWYSFQHGDRANFQTRQQEMKDKGLVPFDIQVQPSNPAVKSCSIYTTSGGIAHRWIWDQTEKEFRENLQRYPADAYRMVSLAVFSVQGESRFTMVLRQDAAKTPWQFRSDMTAEEFAEATAKEQKRGFGLDCVATYPRGPNTRYAAVWVRARSYGPDLRRDGNVPPELQAFDEVMQQFMSERGITSGAVAVAKDGVLALSAGYGNRDTAGTKPTLAQTPFRIASLVKPITAAAVRKIIASGKLSADTPVLPLLKLKPDAAHGFDARWNNITVGHLLDHRGGWDRGKSFDPMFRAHDVARFAGKPAPPEASDVIRYMLTMPLQFDPGQKSVYSNFGYCLLGRVIEQATGKSYFEFVESEILKPLGIAGIAPGRTLVEHRNADEPIYVDEAYGRSVFAQHKDKLVPFPDGAFCLETMDAHGGLIAPMPDLTRFFSTYATNGGPAQRDATEAFFGSLPGTHSMLLRLPGGIVITAAFNRRSDSSGLDYFVLRPMMEEAAKAVKSWPARKQ